MHMIMNVKNTPQSHPALTYRRNPGEELPIKSNRENDHAKATDLNSLKILGAGTDGKVHKVHLSLRFDSKPLDTFVAKKIFNDPRVFNIEKQFYEELNTQLDSQNFYDKYAQEFITGYKGHEISLEKPAIFLELGDTDLTTKLEAECEANSSPQQCTEENSNTDYPQKYDNRNTKIQNKAIHIAQIAAGLHNLHTHGIIHRDLKPENIILKTTEPEKLNNTTDASEAPTTPNTNTILNAKITDLGSALKIGDTSNAGRATISNKYCAPIEIFKFIKSHGRKKFNKEAKKELKHILQPSYDIPGLANLILINFLGDTDLGTEVLGEIFNLAPHNDFEGNIANRNILYHLLSNNASGKPALANATLHSELNSCFTLRINIKTSSDVFLILALQDILESQENPDKKSQNKNDSNESNDKPILNYLNDAHISDYKLSDEELEFIRQICLLCLDEDSQKRPTTAQVGEYFELFAAGCSDFQLAKQLVEEDRPKDYIIQKSKSETKDANTSNSTDQESSPQELNISSSNSTGNILTTNT